MVDEDNLEELTTAEVPPQSPPPIVTQVQHREGRRWLTLIIYLLLALLIALLVVFGGRWIYHQIHHSSAPQPAPVSVNTTPPPPSPNTSSENKTSENKNSSSSSSSQSSSSSSSSGSTGSQPDQSNGISNTGPGDVAALFFGTSAIAAALHYVINLRRATN